jgi:type I restriction enzyme, S subunit
MPTLRQLADSSILYFSDGYRTKRAELGSPGFPILRVANIGNGRIEESATDVVHESLRSRIGPKLAEPGDIVVTTKGTVGRVARIRDTQAGYVYSPQVCFFRIKDRSSINPDYFYYWLRSPHFARQIEGLKSQTDMADYVNLRDLNEIVFDPPDLSVQDAIGEILNKLDERIALNWEMNETLDEVAQTVFRSSIAGQVELRSQIS